MAYPLGKDSVFVSAVKLNAVIFQWKRRRIVEDAKTEPKKMCKSLYEPALFELLQGVAATSSNMLVVRFESKQTANLHASRTSNSDISEVEWRKTHANELCLLNESTNVYFYI